MKKNIQYGFTLIELLIVIALLGALAVGLLASLDPFEQFKKGADTGTRNTVAELQASVIRYYSVKNTLPWGLVAVATETADSLTPVTGGAAIIEEIAGTGELKLDFATIAKGQLPYIYITAPVAGGSAYSFAVCYRPTSKSFIGDANTKFTNAGAVDVAIPLGSKAKLDYCDLPANALSCFWCM